MVTQLLCMVGILFILGYVAIQFLNGLNNVAVKEEEEDKYYDLAETEDGVRTLLKEVKRKRRARGKHGAEEFLSESDDPNVLKFLLIKNEDKKFNEEIGYFTIQNLLSRKGEELIDPLFDMLLNAPSMNDGSISLLANFGDKVLPRLLENLDQNPEKVIRTIQSMAEEIRNPILHSLLNHPQERIRKSIPVYYKYVTSSIEDIIAAYNEEESDKELIRTLSALIEKKTGKFEVSYFDFFLKALNNPNVFKRVIALDLLDHKLQTRDQPLSNEVYILLLKIMQNGTVKDLIEDKSTRIDTYRFLYTFFHFFKEENAERKQEVANAIAADNRIVDDLINENTRFYGRILLFITMHKSDTISIANKKKIFDGLIKYTISSDLRNTDGGDIHFLSVAQYLSKFYKSNLISKDDKKKIFDLGSIIVDTRVEEEWDEYQNEDGGWSRTGHSHLVEKGPVYFKDLLD